MAADDETLLDVFVGIKPKPDFLAEVDRMADEASKRLIQKFGSIQLPGPKMSGPVVVNVAADQERVRLLKEQEAISRKIAETEERIAKAKSNRGNRNTPAAEQKAAQALANAQKEMLKNEEALQALYRQNPYLKQNADVNAIADQIMKHSEDRKKAEKEQRVLIQQTEQAQLKLNKLQGEGNIRFTQAMVDEARARAAAANAAVAARQKSLDEADTPLKTKRRATALGEAQEVARQSEREAAELESKRAASLGRRDEQRANAAKNLADALALQAAGAQRLQEIDARAIVTATELAQKRLLAVQAFEESERKAADAQAKLSSIQANVGPASAKKQQELNEATEEFNRLQSERAANTQKLIDIEQKLAAATFADLNAKSPAADPAKKPRKSKQEIEDQKKILELKKQEETTQGRIVELDRKLDFRRALLRGSKPNTVRAEEQAKKVADLEQRRTEALEEQARIAQQIEAIRSGGAGGGRGGGGSPPASGAAPGSGGGGRGPQNPANAFRNQFKADIEAETRRVTELEVALDRLYETGPQNPEITRQFQILKNVIEDARRELGYLNKDIRTADPSEFAALGQRLQGVGENRQNLSGRVFGSASSIGITQQQSEIQANKELIDLLIRKNQIIKEEDEVRFRLVQRLNQGVAFSDKAAIAEASSRLEIAQKEFNRLSKESDGSKESLDRLRDSFVQLNGLMQLTGEEVERLGLGTLNADPIPGLRGARREIQDEASTRNFGSTNTLSNNAYQLGQAFEDFSVGYSLNGFAGGVRGAANNVAFLLNNLSQSDAFVKSLTNGFIAIRGIKSEDTARRLAEKLSLATPLLAGIGSAIAITVLPKMIEWLESLNDIESEFEDISRRISNDFSDLEFKVSLDSDERNFRRTISRANELKEVLQALADTAEESADRQEDLQKLFNDETSIKNQADAIDQLLSARVFSESRLNRLSNKLKSDESITRSLDSPGVESGAIFLALSEKDRKKLQEDISNAEKLKSSIEQIILDVRDVTAEGATGIFDSAKIGRVVDNFRNLELIYKTLEESDLSEPKQVEEFRKTLDATAGVVDRYNKLALESESINRQLSEGLELATQKAREFAYEQELIRLVVGGANEEILDSFNILKFADAQAAAIEKIRQQRLELEKKRDIQDPQRISLINNSADALREALRLETENQLLLRRKDILGQISDIEDGDRKSQSTTLDDISRSLTTAQLSIEDDEIVRLREQLEIVNLTIAELNASISGQFGGTSGIISAARSIPIGSGNASALGAAIDFGVISSVMRDAVAAGVREAMAGQQKPVVEVMEKVNAGVRQINTGAQN